MPPSIFSLQLSELLLDCVPEKSRTCTSFCAHWPALRRLAALWVFRLQIGPASLAILADLAHLNPEKMQSTKPDDLFLARSLAP